MSYKVSEKVQELFNSIVEMDEVKKALKFIEDDQENTLEEQIDICKVQAPTFQEKERAEHFKNYLAKLGLENVHIDKKGNAVGFVSGTESSNKIVMEGHLDTVFPMGTKIEPRRENGKVYAPGIADDTRGLAVCLAAIRALQASGLKTKRSLLFAGTVEEEGMGGFGGMKGLMEINKDVDGCICVDGFSAQGLVYEATGMKTCEVNFYGKGGHAYGMFGKISNPLHAAARAVAKIADFEVPDDPKTTFCVSNFHAGNDAGIHAIVPQATIKFNIRSNSMEELNKLFENIKKACQEACDEETAKWGKNAVTWDLKQFVDVPAGTQDTHAPIVEALHTVISYLGFEPYWVQGGSTNANMPIGMGVPAVCVGLGGIDNKVHSLDEFFPIEGSYKGVQQAFLMALMLAGIDGKTPSVLDL
ncbi:M20/M25/M40 family metallo-hydrolase [Tyzzerella sp. OttesenSCG-928-J15]|nr:M20/M25/M40 family metallo-hydrolase [Tyzzerella sp. OttesenSCG-928-J15]